MATEPDKIYYDYDRSTLIDSNGDTVRQTSLYPNATIESEKTLNIQLSSVVLGDTENTVTNYEGLPSGTVCEFVVDNDYRTATKQYGIVAVAWSQVGSSSEYKAAIGYDPESVEFNSVEATEGVVGSLAVGEYKWTDDYIYVRLFDDTDPGGKADDWVTGEFQSTSDPTGPIIICESDNFNLADSWYDTTTGLFRNPVVENGELTFLISGDRLEFYMKVAGNKKITADAQIDVYLGGSYLFSKNMFFICNGRLYRGSELPASEIILYSYSKSESDSRFVRQDLTTAYSQLVTIAGTEFLYIRDGANSKYVLMSTLVTAAGAESVPIDASTQIALPDTGVYQYVTLGAQATYRRVVVDLDVDDGTNYIGFILSVRHDGTNAFVTIVNEDGDTYDGLEFDADLDSGNIRLAIKSTAHGSSGKVVWGIMKRVLVST